MTRMMHPDLTAGTSDRLSAITPEVWGGEGGGEAEGKAAEPGLKPSTTRFQASLIVAKKKGRRRFQLEPLSIFLGGFPSGAFAHRPPCTKAGHRNNSCGYMPIVMLFSLVDFTSDHIRCRALPCTEELELAKRSVVRRCKLDPNLKAPGFKDSYLMKRILLST